MNAMKLAALAVSTLFLSACGNSSVSCNNDTSKSCTFATWGGVMSPQPACTGGGTSVDACATGATNTCTWTDSTTFPSPVTYTANFYSGSDLAMAMAACSSVMGTYK